MDYNLCDFAFFLETIGSSSPLPPPRIETLPNEIFSLCDLLCFLESTGSSSPVPLSKIEAPPKEIFNPCDFPFFLESIESSSPAPLSKIEALPKEIFNLCDLLFFLESTGSSSPAPLSKIEALPKEILNRIVEYTGPFDTMNRAVVVHKGIPCEAPPAITQVNKYFYANIIGTYYGTRVFVFLFLGKESIEFHIEKCLKWLSTIGRECAGVLRKVAFLCSKRRHLTDIARYLLPQMRRRGVREDGEGCNVLMTRIPYPFNQDRRVIRRFLDALSGVSGMSKGFKE